MLEHLQRQFLSHTEVEADWTNVRHDYQTRLLYTYIVKTLPLKVREKKSAVKAVKLENLNE